MIRTAMLCDHCDAVFALEESPRRGGLVNSAHENGWTSTYTNGTWTNKCPDHTDNAATAAESR
jgi:hypothetical protein